MATIRTLSPVDGRVCAERTLANAAEIDRALERSRAAQRTWRETPVGERVSVMQRFCAEFERRGTELAQGLSWQMGRPIRFAPE